MKRIISAALRVLAAALVVLTLDQTTKSWVAHNMEEGAWNAKPILGEWLELLYTQNSGLILGFGRGSPMLVNLVIFIATIILLFYAWSEVSRGTNTLALIGVGMIFGGAAGNLSDRLRMGHVIDFISIGKWPVFNLADASIVTGVLVLMISYYFEERAAQKAAREQAALDEAARAQAAEASTETAAADPGAETEAAPSESELPVSEATGPADPPAEPSKSTDDNP